MITIRNCTWQQNEAGTCDKSSYRLYFGNGCVRGTAAMVVWIHMLRVLTNFEAKDSLKDCSEWIQSFCSVPAKYERVGDGSAQAALVSCIARQEQDTQVEGVSTVDWIGIILSNQMCCLGDANPKARSDLVRCMNDLTKRYDDLPEVHAFDEPEVAPPVAKSKRTTGWKVVSSLSKQFQTQQDKADEPQGIRMGVKKVQAIQKFLQHGNDDMLQLMIGHLQDKAWKHSALSDKLLGLDGLYPGVEAKESSLSSRVPVMEFMPPPVGHFSN